MTIPVLNMSQNIVNLYGCYLNDLKFFIMVAITIFFRPMLHMLPNIQVNVSNKPCLYLFECWHSFMYFF